MSTFDQLRRSSPVILPSMLQNDFSNLRGECQRLKEAGARALHLDVMDGTFVPNLSYGLPIVSAFRQSSDLYLDCHLMIDQPEKYVTQFVQRGADLVTIHVESTQRIESCIEAIRSAGAAVGLAVNPDTPIDSLAPYSEAIDLILVMSVHAGFGGQSFIEESLSRLRQARQLAGDFVLQVDGGINASTIQRCADQGVDWFVVGSAIFGQEDYKVAIDELSDLAAVKRDA